MTPDEPGNVRPEVIAAILATGHRERTPAENALLDDATDAEWDTATAIREARWEAETADWRLWRQALERARGRDYRRWRRERRSWIREYGARPVTPTGPSGP